MYNQQEIKRNRQILGRMIIITGGRKWWRRNEKVYKRFMHWQCQMPRNTCTLDSRILSSALRRCGAPLGWLPDQAAPSPPCEPACNDDVGLREYQWRSPPEPSECQWQDRVEELRWNCSCLCRKPSEWTAANNQHLKTLCRLRLYNNRVHMLMLALSIKHRKNESQLLYSYWWIISLLNMHATTVNQCIILHIRNTVTFHQKCMHNKQWLFHSLQNMSSPPHYWNAQSEYSTAAIALITDNQHSKQTEKHSENYTCININ